MAYERDAKRTGGRRSGADCVEKRTEGMQDWSGLAAGDDVEILLDGGRIDTGYIDAIAADKEVLWVIQDGGRGRRLIHADDETLITPTARRTEKSHGEG